LNAGGIAKTCKSSEAAAMLTERRKGEEYISTYLEVEDSQGKLWVILDDLRKEQRLAALRAGNVLSGSWWGNGSPSLRRVAGVRARPATSKLRHCSDSYGRLQ
jgi:hypothetical protein